MSQPGSGSKYYKTFFFHLLDIALVNALVIYRQTPSQAERERDCTHERFRELLIKGIRAKYTTFTQESINAKERTGVANGHHLPVTGVTRGHCTYCANGKKRRKSFKYCADCNTHLCMVAGRDCFADHHLALHEAAVAAVPVVRRNRGI
jgi:hypothetical protein